MDLTKAKKKELLPFITVNKGLSDMISSLYNNLPSTFILHESFVKITKILKLDQIQNFMFNVKQHGYSPNK